MSQPLFEAFGARETIRGWVRGAQTLAILEAAQRAGWLESLRKPTAAPDLPTGVPEALEDTGVLVRTPEGWQVTGPFAALLDGPSGVSLETVLAAARLDVDTVRDLDGDPAGRPDGGQALAVARDSGVESGPVAQALYRSVYEAMPEVLAALEGGGRMLDLGTGIGGALLNTAGLFEGLRLVGVDIVPEVAEEARRRRDALGLTDRVEIRCLDARELPERAEFTVAYWAQCFFPDADRAATLSTLRRALTADGLLVLQEQPAGPLEKVQQARRGISAGRSADDLVAEAERAGFVLVRQVTTALGNLAVVRNQ